MDLIRIDEATCKSDGICTAVCPAGLIYENRGEFPRTIKEADSICIRCGHCVAICPYGSLNHVDIPVKSCPEINEGLNISHEQCEQFLKSRRSIRSYKDKPVLRKDLEKLIEIASYAPSGHNTRFISWHIIDDRQELKRFSGIVIDWMRWMLEGMHDFAVSLHMDRAVERWEAGKDVILRNAPVVVSAHADKNNPMASSSCTIAITYLELAAHGMSLGGCWAGYFHGAAMTYPPMKEALGLTENEQCWGAMMLGYPKYRYYRLPLRKAPEIVWR